MFSLDRDKDTICAVSTAPGIGAIAIIRLSGENAVRIVRAVSRGLPKEIESHRAYYAHIIDTSTKSDVDEVVITFFDSGRSFTTEPVVEVSCHGNPVITEEILQQMIAAGARAAQPGEFTYRAFINGRIDLVQAESVLALIESRSRAAARMALRQLQGAQSQKLDDIIDALTWSMAQIEANIDFSAEDIEVTANSAIRERIFLAQRQLEEIVRDHKVGRILCEAKIVIVGEPNVGKSSLFNRILARERSIVSAEAGTTRDLVESDVSLEHMRATFVDTAGVRATANEIERLGMQKTREALSDADLVLFVFDVRDEEGPAKVSLLQIKAPIISVANKCDLAPEKIQVADVASVSAATGFGVEKLLHRISAALRGENTSSDPAILGVRHLELLLEAMKRLSAGVRLLEKNESGEFVLSELQVALRNCLQILGREFDDQVLDRVFKEFCLGK